MTLPIRIEVVDTGEAIDRVLPDVYDIVEHGLVEIPDTEVVKFKGSQTAAAPPGGKEELVRLVGKAKMLRVHIGENDKWAGEPLYETIVKRANQLDIAGATVYRGILGYGAHKRIHKHHTMTLSSDDPIMIAIIDEEEKINRLLAALDSIVTGGCLIAISDVTVVKYVGHDAGGSEESVAGEAPRYRRASGLPGSHHDAGLVDGLERGFRRHVEDGVVVASVLEPDRGEPEPRGVVEDSLGDGRRGHHIDDVDRSGNRGEVRVGGEPGDLLLLGVHREDRVPLAGEVPDDDVPVLGGVVAGADDRDARSGAATA